MTRLRMYAAHHATRLRTICAALILIGDARHTQVRAAIASVIVGLAPIVGRDTTVEHVLPLFYVLMPRGVLATHPAIEQTNTWKSKTKSETPGLREQRRRILQCHNVIVFKSYKLA